MTLGGHHEAVITLAAISFVLQAAVAVTSDGFIPLSRIELTVAVVAGLMTIVALAGLLAVLATSPRTGLAHTAWSRLVPVHDGLGRSALEGPVDAQLLTRRSAELATLPEVLRSWAAAGYAFATVDQLLPGRV